DGDTDTLKSVKEAAPFPLNGPPARNTQHALLAVELLQAQRMKRGELPTKENLNLLKRVRVLCSTRYSSCNRLDIRCSSPGETWTVLIHLLVLLRSNKAIHPAQPKQGITRTALPARKLPLTPAARIVSQLASPWQWYTIVHSHEPQARAGTVTRLPVCLYQGHHIWHGDLKKGEGNVRVIMEHLQTYRGEPGVFRQRAQAGCR
ncbi:hypothetical protein P4O66_012562, partial [Electrophorus voltai]